MLKKMMGIALLFTCLLLGGCDNVAVYGGVSVGSSWGGYSGMRTSSSISVSGRIR